MFMLNCHVSLHNRTLENDPFFNPINFNLL